MISSRAITWRLSVETFRARLISYRVYLDGFQFEMDAPRGEVVEKHQLVEEAESSRRETRERAALLDLENRTLCADRDNVQSTIENREVRLGESIGEFEKENYVLLECVYAIGGENA